MTLLALVIAGLTGAAPQTPEGPYALIHARQEVATWLDTASIQRRGGTVRARTLRVRGADHAFWLVSEVDCAADAIGLVSAQNRGDAAATPFLDGTVRLSPIKAHDQFSRAFRAALCDGARPYDWAQPAADADAAMAASVEARRRGEAERPMALIPADVERFALHLDRETLQGGGPQWELMTLTISLADYAAGDGRAWGGWTRWEIDCADHTADKLSFAVARGTGQVEAQTRDTDPREDVTPDHEAAPILALACDTDPWSLPALDSLDAIVRRAAQTDAP